MPQPPQENKPSVGPASLLTGCAPLVELLYSQSGAGRWGLSQTQFVGGLERSLCKRFQQGPPSSERLEEYLLTLHVEDLALTTACIEGSEAAWEYFVREYRGYLRAAAGAISKASRYLANPQELADSLFSDLFGLMDGKRGERSLFRYFHGRSSLKTWLRAIMAQRYVDKIREGKRWEVLEDGDGNKPGAAGDGTNSHTPADPHRGTYTARFSEALKACLAELEARDSKRLELYYAREITLAEIGREFGEHESSVSRNLERIRRELRAKVEAHLRTVCAMSEAQVALCFQYAAEDALIDFRQLFRHKKPRETGTRRGEV